MDARTTARIQAAAERAAVSVSQDTLRLATHKISIAFAVIGVPFTGNLRQQVETAFGHLAAAAEGSPEGGQAELRQARAAAARLIHGPDPDPDPGWLLGTPAVAEVLALGHLVNYYHSLISRVPRQALIDGYQCTELFPALGVQLLPAEYFSRDYRRLTAGLAAPAGRGGGRDWRGYALEKAWRVPAAGGIFLLGLLSSAQGHAGDIMHGGHRAWDILAEGDYGLLPAHQDAAAGSSRPGWDRHSVNRLLAGVVEESRERRLAVEAHW